MGWWNVGNQGEVIGDDSADTVTDILEESASGFDLPKFLDTLAAALKRAGFAFSRLRAKTTQDEVTSSADAMPTPFDEGLEQLFQVYQNDFERPPSLVEILESFAFVLRHRPDRFLDGMDGRSLKSITAE